MSRFLPKNMIENLQKRDFRNHFPPFWDFSTKTFLVLRGFRSTRIFSSPKKPRWARTPCICNYYFIRKLMQIIKICHGNTCVSRPAERLLTHVASGPFLDETFLLRLIILYWHFNSEKSIKYDETKQKLSYLNFSGRKKWGMREQQQF